MLAVLEHGWVACMSPSAVRLWCWPMSGQAVCLSIIPLSSYLWFCCPQIEMLALLKGGRAAVVCSPVARAAAGRVQPSLAQAASSRRQPLSSGAAAALQLLTLHRRLLAMLRQQSRALLRLSVIQCEFVLIYRTRRTMQVSGREGSRGAGRDSRSQCMTAENSIFSGEKMVN